MKLSLKNLFAITTVAIFIVIAINLILDYREEQEFRRLVHEACLSGRIGIDSRDWRKIEKEEVAEMLSTPASE